VKGFLSAVQFITILPWGRSESFDPPRMIPYFPLVGIALGLLLALFDYAAGSLWGRSTGSLLDIVFLAALTGAFHLDGLGDAADGMLGQRSKEKMLTIMKDSRLGTMGLVAILASLSIKWAGIAGLDTHRPLLLVIVPAYARASMLFGMRQLPYGRPEGGTGAEFFKADFRLSALWGLAIPVLASFFLGWKMIWLNLWFAVLTAGLIRFYRRRIGCITGDMLGAMAEITEAGLFLMASMGGGR